MAKAAPCLSSECLGCLFAWLSVWREMHSGCRALDTNFANFGSLGPDERASDAGPRRNGEKLSRSPSGNVSRRPTGKADLGHGSRAARMHAVGDAPREGRGGTRG